MKHIIILFGLGILVIAAVCNEARIAHWEAGIKRHLRAWVRRRRRPHITAAQRRHREIVIRYGGGR